MKVFAPTAFRYPSGPSGTDYPYGWQDLPESLADTLVAAGLLAADKPDNAALAQGESYLKVVTKSAQGIGFSVVASADIAAEFAALLGWDTALCPLKVSLRYSPDGTPWGISDLSLWDYMDIVHPDWRTGWQTVWVDGGAASNGDGLTSATPFNSYGGAQAYVNGTQNHAIYKCKGGHAPVQRSKNFSQSGATNPSKHGAWIAYGGRCNVTAYEPRTWATDGTYPNCQKTARSNAASGFNPALLTSKGRYTPYTKVATLTECNNTPGTWWTDNVNVYARSFDGSVISDANFRLYLATDNVKLTGTNQYTFVLLNADENSGWDLEGGQAGCFRTQFTGIGGGRVLIGADTGTTFLYAGHLTGAVGGISCEGVNGLCYFSYPVVCDSATDAINFHNANMAAGAVMYHLTIGDFCEDAGIVSTYVSNNGVTSHDNCVGVAIAGKYSRARGVTAHNIDTSRLAVIAPTVSESLGDVAGGGGNQPGTHFKVQGDAVMILINPIIPDTDCRPLMTPIRVEGNGRLYYRGLGPMAKKIMYVGATASVQTI